MTPDLVRAAVNLTMLRHLTARTRPYPCPDCEGGHLCRDCMAEAARDDAADRAGDEKEERRG